MPNNIKKKIAHLKKVRNFKARQLQRQEEEQQNGNVTHKTRIHQQETITDQETDSLTREKQRDCKRNINTTQCEELTPKTWKRRRKAREVLNENRWSDLRKIDEDDQNDFKPNKIITRSQPLKTNFEIKGNRIVDLAHLGSTLENGCTFCLEKPLCLSNATSEKQKGFVSVFKILCHKCRKYNFVRTQKVEKTGKTQENVNQLAVLGSLHTEVGATHLEAIMATMEVPVLSRRSFSDIKELSEKR